MDERVYTERKILIGVLLGGSLAGAYYFWRTFNALGKPKYATAALVTASVVFTATIVTVFIPALDRIPQFVFWGTQIGLVYGAIRGTDLNTILNERVATGGSVYGWGNTIVVAIISLVVTLGVLASTFFISPFSFDRTTTKRFGTLQHEIVYDPGNISELDIGRLASALTTTGFFDDEVQKTIDAARSDNRFVITVYCNESARDPEAIAFYKEFRSELQKLFPSDPIVIDMVIGTPDNRIARLE